MNGRASSLGGVGGVRLGGGVPPAALAAAAAGAGVSAGAGAMMGMRRAGAGGVPQPSMGPPMPSAMPVRMGGAAGGRGSGVAAGGAPAEVEREYIGNLQQQIYFLELELRYLRERAAAPGPSLKSRGTAPDASMQDADLAAAGTLDEAMRGLKIKYVDMERKYTAELEAAQTNVRQLEEAISKLQYKAERDAEEKQMLRIAMQQQNDDHRDETERTQADLADTQKRLEETGEKLQALDNEHQGLLQRHREVDEAMIPYKTRITQLEDDVKQLQELRAQDAVRMDELQQEITRLNTVIGECRDRIASLEATEAEMRERLAKNERERWELEETTRKAKQEMELSIVQRDTLQKDSDRLNAENSELHRVRSELDRDLGDARRRIAEQTEKERRMLEEAERLRGNETQAYQERDRALGLVAGLEDRLRKAYDTECDALRRADDFEAKMRELQRTVEEQGLRVQQLDAQNSKLAGEHSGLEEQIAKLTTLLEQRDARVAKLTDELAVATTQIAALQKRLSMSKDLESINFREFESLMGANLQVASNIQKLMGHFQAARDVFASQQAGLPLQSDAASVISSHTAATAD